MRKLRKRDPITVVLLDRTWKARVTATGHGRVFFRLPYDEDFDLSDGGSSGAVARRDEGRTWVRGWTTEEAKAFAVSWGLG